jgi:integrase
MPRIVAKREVLSGRGAVVLYGSGTSAGSYFYRELIKGSRSYRQRKIPDATTMDEAVQLAVEVAFAMQAEELETPDLVKDIFSPSKPSVSKSYETTTLLRQPRRQLIEDSITNFLEQERQRKEAGLITSKTRQQKEITLTQHMLPYLSSQGVLYTNQIRPATFKDYELFRSGATPLSRNVEIGHIKDFCKNYLVKNRLLDADMLLDRGFLPRSRVKQVDRMKNPAINEDDWKTIVDYVRGPFRDSAKLLQNHRIHYWRTLFWHFILFMKNTGMSPEEILKMKWKQIEIVDEGRVNSKGEREEWLVSYIYTVRSKTKQAREIPANQARELIRWKKLQQEYMEARGLKQTVDRETIVFSNPNNELKSYGYSNFQRSWKDVLDAVSPKLKGHRFSPHPYTIYSMRSTFIEDHLLKGTPVYEVAEMAGHSVMETQKTYARLNLRNKGREITMPNMGKKERQRKGVVLF